MDVSAAQSESVLASGEVEHPFHMLVPSTPADTFLATLKSYSQSCDASCTAVQDKCEQFNEAQVTSRATVNDLREAERSAQSTMEQFKAMMNGMEDKLKRCKEQVKRVEKESAAVGVVANKVASQGAECRRNKERVDQREKFICDYVDIVRESETLMRQKYTRTIYAATLTKEVSKASLSALESTLSLIDRTMVGECGGEDTAKIP